MALLEKYIRYYSKVFMLVHTAILTSFVVSLGALGFA